MEAKKILIIDDDLAFSEMLSEILRDEEFEVTVTHDGVQGLQTAITLQPDLVMCDVMMPGMTGVQLVQKLRADSWGATVPIILLTNMTQPELENEIVESSAHTECLLKTDWTLDKLTEKIKSLLA